MISTEQNHSTLFSLGPMTQPVWVFHPSKQHQTQVPSCGASFLIPLCSDIECAHRLLFQGFGPFKRAWTGKTECRTRHCYFFAQLSTIPQVMDEWVLVLGSGLESWVCWWKAHCTRLKRPVNWWWKFGVWKLCKNIEISGCMKTFIQYLNFEKQSVFTYEYNLMFNETRTFLLC